MAEPTPLNGQITDAVTQSNVIVLGSAPATALGGLFQVSAHAMGLMMENAVLNQQQMAILGQAVTASAVAAVTKANPGGT
jgi:hypothetical protein